MKPQLNTLLTPRTASFIAFLGSAALLAGAHLFERVGGMVPCMLCYEQREVHWIVLAVAGLGLAASFLGLNRWAILIGLVALTGVLLWSTWLAGYHAGVEWKFWEGPASCSGGQPVTDMDSGDLLASIQGPGMEGPPCSEAAWRMFGISMAGYNALFSAALAALSAAATRRLVRKN